MSLSRMFSSISRHPHSISFRSQQAAFPSPLAGRPCLLILILPPESPPLCSVGTAPQPRPHHLEPGIRHTQPLASLPPPAPTQTQLEPGPPAGWQARQESQVRSAAAGLRRSAFPGPAGRPPSAGPRPRGPAWHLAGKGQGGGCQGPGLPSPSLPPSRVDRPLAKPRPGC